MTITLPLEPQEQAKLVALANARGVSADELVRQAVDQILNSASDVLSAPKKSMYGFLAQYGPDPSDREIDENRREMFRGLAEDDL